MTNAAMIDSIAEHLAATELDGRTEFIKQLDAVLKPHGLCVVAHPVERVMVTSDEIDEADFQNEQYRAGYRATGPTPHVVKVPRGGSAIQERGR
ncbi:MAG: hypothetical protein IID33_14500 [Planctomycetes bacterium]|nr:hypothetical protein [Planctomycetota bacterium]